MLQLLLFFNNTAAAAVAAATTAAVAAAAPAVVAAAAAACAAAQKRSLVKNQRFLPPLNFSSNSFLASCKWHRGGAARHMASRVQQDRL